MCSSRRWPASLAGRQPSMPTDIGLDRLKELAAAGAQLVEVLPADAYEQAHLPDAVNLPLATLREPDVDVLERSRPVVVYCWDPL